MFLKKKIIFGLIISFILLISTTIGYAINRPQLHDKVNNTSIVPVLSTLKSNRYTQMDDLSTIDQNPYVSLNNHQYLGTNSQTNLSLYVNPETLSLRIKNETSGFIWGSNMDHDYLDENNPLYNPDNPNTNIRQDNSPVSITYYNTTQTTLVRQSEYFFEGAFDGSFIKEDLNDKLGFIAHLKMPRSGIMFDLIVYLDELGLHVVIPYDSVKDNGNFLISTITVYRNFGFTTRDLIPGYVFIPDGIGSLIRYDDQYNINYSKRFYGPDPTLGQETIERYLTASVYGTVQGINQNAMMVIIDEGAPNGTLTYQSHTPNMMFNKIYTNFEYRDKYIQKLNASGSSTIEMIQKDKNVFNIHYIYKFINGEESNYVGFADKYRNYLKDKGYQFELNESFNNIPLHLDILALENKKVWYGRETFTMTNAKQINQITDELLNESIESIYATIHGWQKNGLSRTSPSFGSLDKKFGNPKDYEKDNLKVFYAVTPRLGYLNDTSYKSSDVVQNQGSEFIKFDNYYLLNANSALKLLTKHYNRLSKQQINNLSFEDMDILNSDYHQILSRSETIDILKDYLEIADQTIVSKPFDYLFGAKIIKEIDLYSSQRISFTDTVPFLTLVLGGNKVLFGRSANFFANKQNELLRMIDYQVYPNFYLTYNSAQLLLNTDSNFIFTSKYIDWKDEIINQYNYVNNALKNVTGFQVIKRVVMKPGVILNEYNNGVKIYINYSGNDYLDGNVVVKAMDYEVVL